MDIEKYVDRIPGFYELSSGEMIKYFVYYIQIELKKEANVKDIKNCYDKLDIIPYSNIPMYLRNNKYFVKLSEGYKLERNLKKEIETELSTQDVQEDKKILISHSSCDKVYGTALVNLLRGMGLKKNQIIFSSNDLYGIPLGTDIFDFLRENINEKILVIFLLSDNYFDSVACLNEMGAAWVAKNDYEIMATPEFDFSSKKFKDSCINTRQNGMKLNNWIRITEFKEKLKDRFNITIDEIEWQELIEKFKEELEKA